MFLYYMFSHPTLTFSSLQQKRLIFANDRAVAVAGQISSAYIAGMNVNAGGTEQPDFALVWMMCSQHPQTILPS